MTTTITMAIPVLINFFCTLLFLPNPGLEPEPANQGKLLNLAFIGGAPFNYLT